MALKKTEALEQPARAKNETAPQAGAFCVYIGPTIVGVIQSGTIYPGGRAQALRHAAAAIEEYPQVASLIVPDSTLPRDRVKVKTPGNLLYHTYQKLASGTDRKGGKPQ